MITEEKIDEIAENTAIMAKEMLIGNGGFPKTIQKTKSMI